MQQGACLNDRMKNNAEDDSELREIAKRMTVEEMRELAVELEREAKVMRQFASCVEFAGPQILLGHVRWSLDQGEQGQE